LPGKLKGQNSHSVYAIEVYSQGIYSEVNWLAGGSRINEVRTIDSSISQALRIINR
jgi:hypothetical protein